MLHNDNGGQEKHFYRRMKDVKPLWVCGYDTTIVSYPEIENLLVTVLIPLWHMLSSNQVEPVTVIVILNQFWTRKPVTDNEWKDSFFFEFDNDYDDFSGSLQ